MKTFLFPIANYLELILISRHKKKIAIECVHRISLAMNKFFRNDHFRWTDNFSVDTRLKGINFWKLAKINPREN